MVSTENKTVNILYNAEYNGKTDFSNLLNWNLTSQLLKSICFGHCNHTVV